MKQLGIFARLIVFVTIALPAWGQGPASSSPRDFVTLGHQVVFFAHDPNETGALWTTDGTPAGTRELTAEAPPVKIAGLAGGAELWFVQEQLGASLWRTKGTPDTTFPLVTEGIFIPDPDAYPIPSAIDNGKLYFFKAATAFELWVSDGTRPGTRRIASLPNDGNSTPLLAASAGGRLFFLTAHRRPGPDLSFDHFALWRSDGTAKTTKRLSALPDYVFSTLSTSRRLFFVSGARLWVSDGSVAGTSTLFAPADPAAPVIHLLLGAAGPNFYFLAEAGTQGDTLWVTDGTRRGTRIVSTALTLTPASPFSATLGNRIFFLASDAAHGTELWTSAGTPRTTSLVADLCPGPCSAFAAPNSPSLTPAGGKLFFLAQDPNLGTTLFVSNGTRAGTQPVASFCSGDCAFSAALTPVGNEVYFYARDPAQGMELWASNGTPAGTRRLSDFNVAEPFPFLPGGAQPAPDLAVLGPKAVSTGFDTLTGFEPWVFDRAGGGGQLLVDVLP
ncbi:MAG TPA: hypothetical protein VF173_05940 [Thermoanaerobaculia bacterium]|nr:hypothetical protein [Thermoanaerobaculia bacterium]